MEVKRKSKEELELEKLEVEIKNIKTPIYKKLSFYSALAPIIVSIAAVYLSVNSNIFETGSKILTLQKENLKYEIINFEQKKDSLTSTINNLNWERDSLVNNNQRMLSENQRIEKLLTKKTEELVQVKNLVIVIQDSVKSKQTQLDSIFVKYNKLSNDKELLASKMKDLQYAIKPSLKSDEKTKILFSEIMKILDENLGGFGGSSMLLLFSQ